MRQRTVPVGGLADAVGPGLEAATLEALAVELDQDGQRIGCELSGEVTSEVQTNPQEAARTSRDLAANGHYAVSLVNQFAGLVDDFDTEVNRINTNYHTSVGAQRRSTAMAISRDEDRTLAEDLDVEGIRASVKASLQGDYDKAASTLDDDADSIATKFDQGPTTANVREMIRQGLMPLSAAVLYPDLELTAADKYQAVRTIIEDGELTEERRQQIMETHPGLLNHLMGVENPNQEQRETIIALALPQVDGQDAGSDVSTIEGALDGTQSPEDFREALGNSEEIGKGLALLAPWLAKHGVKLNDSWLGSGASTGRGVHEYLERFADETGPRLEDVREYIGEEEHSWFSSYNTPSGTITNSHEAAGFGDDEQDELLGVFADNYLNVSNEQFGGSYGDMPSEVREPLENPSKYHWFLTTKPGDIPNDEFADMVDFLGHGEATGGEQFSRNLGIAAQEYNNVQESTNLRHDPYGVVEYDADDSAVQAALGLVGRNHQASHDLITGQNLGEVPDGLQEAAGDHTSKDYLQWLYTTDWDDNGAAASSLSEWTAAPGPGEQQIADATFNTIYDTLAGDQETFDQVITFGEGPQEGDSVGEANPHLMRGLALQTSTRLDEFDTYVSPEEEKQRIKLFTLINGDHATSEDGTPDPNSGSVRLAAAIEAYQQDRINNSVDPDHDYPEGDPHQLGTVGDDNGRLSGYQSAALHNTFYAEYDSDVEAAEAVADNQRMAVGVVNHLVQGGASAAGPYGVPLGISSNLMTEMIQSEIEAEDVEIPQPTDPATYGQGTGANLTADTTGLEFVTRTQYLQAHIANGDIDPADLPGTLQVDGDTGQVDISNVSTEDMTHLNDELAQIMPEATNEEVGNLTQRRTEIRDLALNNEDELTGR